MNPIRLRYFICCVIFLVLAIVLAFSLADVPDPMVAEFGILLFVVLVLAFLMGRHSDREDETAGIISMDDDD